MTHGRYPYTCNITATVFGLTDATVTLMHDFECELTIEVDISSGDPVAVTTEVYVEGRSLAAGDDLSRLIRLQVMEKAEDEMAAGGWLWDEVRDAEGLVYQGLGGNDPDGRWVHA